MRQRRGDVRKARNVTPTPRHWCSAICLESAVASDTWTRAAGQSAGTCSRPPAVRDNHDTAHRPHCILIIASLPLIYSTIQEHVLSLSLCSPRYAAAAHTCRLQYCSRRLPISCRLPHLPFLSVRRFQLRLDIDKFCYHGLSVLFIEVTQGRFMYITNSSSMYNCLHTSSSKVWPHKLFMSTSCIHNLSNDTKITSVKN